MALDDLFTCPDADRGDDSTRHLMLMGPDINQNNSIIINPVPARDDEMMWISICNQYGGQSFHGRTLSTDEARALMLMLARAIHIRENTE